MAHYTKDDDNGGWIAERGPQAIRLARETLCANAEYAMRNTGGILEVRLGAIELDAAFTAQHPLLLPGPHVRLTVRDTGHGMAPEVMGRIFEPFFTTKGVGQGTGMGLAVVHGIITSHNGAITVQSVPGQGTTFMIYLPQVEATPHAAASPMEPLLTGKGCILFVDDEEALALWGQELLAQLGYEVVACTSSLEALEAFRSIDAEKAAMQGIDVFLMKPILARELGLAIQQVLAQRTVRDVPT